MPLSRTVLPSADVENKSTAYVCTSLCSLAAAGSLKFLSLKTSPEQNSSAWETRPALQATDKSAVATRDPWQSVELGWQQITGVLAARHPSLAPFFTVAASEGDQQRCATPKTFKLLETMWPQNGRRPAGPMSHTEALGPSAPGGVRQGHSVGCERGRRQGLVQPVRSGAAPEAHCGRASEDLRGDLHATSLMWRRMDVPRGGAYSVPNTYGGLETARLVRTLL